jgi:Mn-containing catalase
MHNKRLMYTVRAGAPDPKLANLILEQFGGAEGGGLGLAASPGGNRQTYRSISRRRS